jgi:hypothetical protein
MSLIHRAAPPGVVESGKKADVVSKVIGDFSDNLATYSKAFPRFLNAPNRPRRISKDGKA